MSAPPYAGSLDVVDGSARWCVSFAEAIDTLRALPDACVDAIVTDPPAGIRFMGVAWDTFEARAKGTGRDRALAFDKVGGNHNPSNPADRARTTRAEGARFRAALEPIFAECLRVAKPSARAIVWAIPRTSHWTATALEDAGWEIVDVAVHLQAQGFPKSRGLLKPAAEHWILARKPGPVAPLNVDACRIGTSKDVPASVSRTHGAVYSDGLRHETGAEAGHDPNVGRWPANATLDEGAALLLDAQSGTRKSGAMRAGTLRKNLDSYSGSFSESHGTASDIAPSAGGASRFFYVSKCKGNERKGNPHPTPKPVDLMRWLCRLVTPAGGLVVDPFCGSGSTGEAALAEGLRFIGIEREDAYVQYARPRLAAVERALAADTTTPAQLSLLGSDDGAP